MKKRLLLVVSGLLFLLPNADATHIVGGDISYQHLEGNTYEILLRVYRDCYGGLPEAFFDNPASIGIFDENNMLVEELEVNYVSDDTLSAIFANPCLNIPENVCVHTTEYRDTVTLAPLSSGQYYKFVYQRCCRNSTITNIANPGETGISYTIDMTAEAMALNNSTPDFGPPAPIYICLGEPVDYNHLATEADGDSLVYKFCTPKEGASIDVTKPQPPNPPPYDDVFFNTGYDLTTLLGDAQVPLTINSETGFITGVPELAGQFVVGVCVEEYRDGQLISTVNRDFQWNVGQCLQVASFPVAPSVQCDDLVVEFTNSSTESEEFEWYFNYPDDLSAFSSEIAPTYTYPDTGTYTIRLIAEPDKPCADTTDFEIFLQNNSIDANFEPDLYDCDTESILILENLVEDPISPIISWNWTVSYGNETLTSNLPNPQFSLPPGVTAEIELAVVSQNGCEKTVSQEIETGLDENNPILQIDTDHEICAGETVELNPDFLANLQGYTYLWSPVTGLDDPTLPNPSATPNSTTTYSVSITALEGVCIRATDVLVEVIPLPEVNFDYEIQCNDLTVNFNNTSLNTPGIEWDFGDTNSNGDISTSNTPTYTYPDYGTYDIMLMVEDDHLCLDTITQTITLVPQIFESDFAYSYIDCSEDEISIQFTNTSQNTLNNTNLYTWSFSNNSSSNEINPTVTLDNEQTLTATLTIATDEDCTSSSTQTLDIDFTELNISPDPVQVCLGTSQGLNPGGNNSYTYNWSPAEGLDDSQSPNPIASPLETTTYSVTVTNTNNPVAECVIIKEVTVFVPLAIELNTSDDINTCEDMVTLTATTTQDADLVWNPINLTTSSIDVNVSGVTTYTVVATDEFGCTEAEQVTTSGGAVSIEATGDAVICDDVSLNIGITNFDSNDELSFDWTPLENIISGENTSNPNVTNEPGIYTYNVTATSQFNCEASDEVQAIIYDADAAFDFTYEIECSGATVNFTNTSQNAFGYHWDFGIAGTDTDISTQESPSFTFPGPGTYNVTLGTIYDVDCVTPTVISVNIPEVLLITDFELNYESCETDQVIIAFTDLTQNFLNNTASWNWTFSSGTTSEEQNPTLVLTGEQIPLTVTLTVTTDENCESSISQEFNVDFIEENTVEEILICHGESTELNSGGSSVFDYVWSPSETLSDANSPNPIANPTETTTYTVNITNTTNADVCEITREVTVVVPEKIDLEVTNDLTTCGENITLEATTATDVNVSWIDLNNDSYTGQSIDVLPTTVMTYYATATDAFGCTEQDTTTVLNGNMDLSTEGIRNICPSESLVIEAYNTDFSDVADWQWEAGTNGTINSGGNTPTPNVSVSIEGIPVQFYVTATNQYNCTSQDSVTVIMSEFMPTFDAQVSVCAGIDTALNPNANEQYQYEWSPNTGLDNPNIPNPTINIETDQTYSVTITDFQGIDTCFTIETVQVTVNPEIGLQAFGEDSLCNNETVNISATSATSADFIWATEPDFNSNNIIGQGAEIPITPEGEVTYYVQATDELGCTETESVSLSSFQLDIDLANSVVLCFGESVILGVTNNAVDQSLTYSWTPIENIMSGANTANPEVNPDTTTMFYVEVENQIGCTILDSIEVIVENVEIGLFATADPDTILLGSSEFSQLMTNENDDFKYSWNPSSSLNDETIFNPEATPEETTVYTVEITGELGCTAERSVEVVVVDIACEEPFVFVPSGFTPNDDGENDIFYVRGNNIEEVFLTVYNRWGEKMFETNDKDIGWDGTFKSQQLPPDVYGYYMNIKCFNGDEYFKKGNISLLR